MREYQAVARWKMRGSKIWYYIFFIIVGGSPIWFLEWFGDTFKIKKGVECFLNTVREISALSLIFVAVHRFFIGVSIVHVIFIDLLVWDRKNQGQVDCTRTFYFITQVPPNHSRNHEGLHPTIIKKNVVSNFRSSHFSSSYSPIFTHCDHPQL